MRGCIVKRGKNAWAVVLSFGKNPTTGRRRRKWYPHKTRREAQAHLTEILHAMQQGTWALPSKTSFAEYFEGWLRNTAGKIRPTTFASYNMIARKHLIPEFGHLPLMAVSPVEIRAYFTKKLEAGLSSTTVRHHAMLLHEVLATAVREGLLAQNPADRVDVPRNSSVEMQALDAERAQLFLAAARRTSSLYPLYACALLLGLRMGELLGLAWRHVSLTLGQASIVQTVYWLYGSKKECTSTQLLFKEPKSKQSRRVVPLPSPLPELLTQLREGQGENRRLLDDRYHEHDLVFCQSNGRPLHPADVRKDLHRVLKAAGLPRIRFHDLRHSAAALRLAQGDNLKIIQELLGHASAGFTLQVYGHLAAGLQEQSAKTLAGRLFRDPSAG